MNSEMIRGMLIPDLRTALRSRGLSPAGSREVLQDRLNEYCNESGEMGAPEAYNVRPSANNESESAKIAQRQGSSLGYLFGGDGPSAAPSPGGKRGGGGPPPSQIFNYGAEPENVPMQHQAPPPPAAAPADDGFSKEDAAVIAGMALPDLRSACRRFGLSPAGQRGTLQQRLLDYFQGKPSNEKDFVPNSSSASVPQWMQAPVQGEFDNGRGNPGRNSQLGYLFGGGAAN